MLKYTFCHIDGLSVDAEKVLWNKGIICWDDYLRCSSNIFSPSKDKSIRHQLGISRLAMDANSVDFFLSRLNNEQAVRIYPQFRKKTVFLDIETTGLSIKKDQITTIALYDGQSVKNYVNGKDLWQFVADISKYTIIVTYNGTKFDIPFIRKYFKISLNHFHIDLCPVLRRIGYKGGQKMCEKKLGLHRQIKDIDGVKAVELWDLYKKKDDLEALNNLILYNSQDVLSLEHLIIKSYNLVMQDCPVSTKILLTKQPLLI